MKNVRIALIAVMVLGFTTSLAFAGKKEAANGKKLFNDTKLSGATSGMSCATCHPKGQGLAQTGKKTSGFKTPGGEFATMPEAINKCIVMAINGKALETDSKEMKEIVAYFKSLKKKSTPKGPAMMPKMDKMKNMGTMEKK